jgi:hypothetical protein
VVSGGSSGVPEKEYLKKTVVLDDRDYEKNGRISSDRPKEMSISR